MSAHAVTQRLRLGPAAVALLMVGVLLCAGYRVASGAEHHAYSSGGPPPGAVRLTAGTSYLLSVRGGMAALRARGADPTAARCDWSVDGSAAQALTVTPLGADTNATDAVASFVAPYTGELQLACDGWGAVYVDDADKTAFDTAGLLLVLATITLTIGAGLGLSALRSASRRTPAST